MPHSDSRNWDLVSAIGATATLAAAARAHSTNADPPLINDPYAEPLVRAVGIDHFIGWATGTRDASQVGETAGIGIELLTGIVTARTRFFDEFLSRATASGIRQVVILASGLDTRGYRLGWPLDTVIFEIDVPDVLSFKAKILAELGAQPSADIRHIAVDLRDGWPKELQEAEFRPNLPSAWIAEGLLPFLPPDAQDRMLDDITRLSFPGSQLACEVEPISADTARPEAIRPPGRALAEADHSEQGTEYLTSRAARRDVATYLNARGWRSNSIDLLDLLTAAGIPKPVTVGDPPLRFGYYCTSTIVGS
jgi:methyltransferase (TIGR00027 family)